MVNGRYEALKELNLPIEYIVQPGINIKECIAKLLYNYSQMHASFQINGTVLKNKKNVFYSSAPIQESPVWFFIHSGRSLDTC